MTHVFKTPLRTPLRTLALLAVLAVISVGSLTGCTRPDGSMSRETVGSVVGAIGGAFLGAEVGLAGSPALGASVGTFVGTTVGREIGKGMDQRDIEKMYEAQQEAYAAPIGETIYWENPETENHGSFTATRQGETISGQYCREFEQTITVDGEKEMAYGTACQQPDGSWQVINN